MSDPFPPPYESPHRSEGEDNQTMAIAILVMGITSWFMFGLLASIPAAILGHLERKKIASGQAVAHHSTLVNVGFWVSVANIVVLVLGAILGAIVFCGFWGLGLSIVSLGAAGG